MRLCAVIGGVAFVYVATVHGTEKWRMVNYGDGIPRENRPVFLYLPLLQATASSA